MRNERTARKKYRIASPVRFFIFILIVVLGISMIIYSLLGKTSSEAASYGSYDRSAYEKIEVRENDSLWTIVDEYCGDLSEDPREVIDEICRVNGIDAGDIQPGDTLMVPVRADGSKA